jgi:hypothetical protein
MYITPEGWAKSLKAAFISEPIWAWAVTWTKISVLLMLLRIKKDPLWVKCLWTFIAVVVMSGIATNVAMLTQCHPLRANYDLSISRSNCWGTETILKITYIISGKTSPACGLDIF